MTVFPGGCKLVGSPRRITAKSRDALRMKSHGCEEVGRCLTCRTLKSKVDEVLLSPRCRSKVCLASPGEDCGFIKQVAGTLGGLVHDTAHVWPNSSD